MMKLQATVVTEGTAAGEVLRARQPLSFWGGVDFWTGEVIDVHHDLTGKCLAGKVLLIPAARGSCSGGATFLEMVRAGVNPVAVVMIEAEPIISLGAVLAKHLYEKRIPMCTITAAEYESIQTGDRLSIAEDGTITVE